MTLLTAKVTTYKTIKGILYMKPLAMLLSTFLILTSTAAKAGPFGFDWSSKTPPEYCEKNRYEKFFEQQFGEPKVEGSYDCTLPIHRRHSAFNKYSIEFYKNGGVCEINASGDLEVSGTENPENIAEFYAIRDVLVKKYGSGEFSNSKKIKDNETAYHEFAYMIAPQGKSTVIASIKLEATIIFNRGLCKDTVRGATIQIKYRKRSTEGATYCVKENPYENERNNL